MPALVIWQLRAKRPPSIAGITARPALAKAQRSHYVQAKSSLDDPPLMAVGTEAISL
jgi:hypothetical protein